MKDNNTEFIKEEILAFALKKKGTDFIKLTQFLKTLSPEEKKHLDLPASANQATIKSQLDPLPENYKLKNKASSIYIVLKAPMEDLMTESVILNMIHSQEGRTVAQLSTEFPFTKTIAVELIVKHANRLIKNGKASVQITAPQGLARLFPAPERIHATGREPKGIQNQTTAFKKAFDTVGKGRPFVFICEIRRHLNWPREQFDQMLAQLRKEGYIAAHTGTPGDLSTEDVVDSYQDSYGDLYITVNWRKPI